jgi:hypothetical protein
MRGEPQGPPPLLAWAIVGAGLWLLVLGWLVTPWLSVAGAWIVALMFAVGLEWANRGR